MLKPIQQGCEAASECVAMASYFDPCFIDSEKADSQKADWKAFKASLHTGAVCFPFGTCYNDAATPHE